MRRVLVEQKLVEVRALAVSLSYQWSGWIGGHPAASIVFYFETCYSI